MNGQLLYICLGVACVVMFVGIVYQLSRGKSVAGITPRPSAPVLPPSNDQKIRDHVKPIFDDMIDKEKAEAVSRRLYAAWKDQPAEPGPVTGISSSVKGG